MRESATRLDEHHEMRIPYLTMAILGLVLPMAEASAQQNSGVHYPHLLEMRDSGRHALYLSDSTYGFAQVPVPDEGCTLVDRALIDETSPGSAAIIQALNAALTEYQRISIRVDGCLEIQTGSGTTAPRLIKVNFLRRN